jgi:hypothetical protein
MKVVILPMWLRKSLEFSKIELRYALSLEKLTTILSLDDVAFYLYINSMSGEFVNEVGLSSFEPLNILEEQKHKLSEETLQQLTKLLDYYSYRPKADKVAALLGTLEIDGESESVKYGYKVELLDEDTLGVFPYILDEGADTTRAALTFADELIKHHLITTPFEVVAKTQHFKKYITLLEYL